MKSIEERFWEKVDRKDLDECWEFIGGKTPAGHGHLWVGGGVNTHIYAHRFSWELSRKCKVPKGKMILHLCDNPSCVNPMHLYCGTGTDNAKDRSKHDELRCIRISLAKAKFYAGEIWLIRKLKDKFSSRFVARMFKADKGTILNIWKSINYPCKEGYFVNI